MFPMFEVNVTPLEPKQFTLPQAGRCGEENERAFAKSEMVYQSSDFQGGTHNWSAAPSDYVLSGRIISTGSMSIWFAGKCGRRQI